MINFLCRSRDGTGGRRQRALDAAWFVRFPGAPILWPPIGVALALLGVFGLRDWPFAALGCDDRRGRASIGGPGGRPW